jgi:hypothetical protein
MEHRKLNWMICSSSQNQYHQALVCRLKVSCFFIQGNLIIDLQTEVLNSPQAQSLSDYEKEEIVNYPQVYCTGSGSQKKKAHPDIVLNNFGYDDERGDYQVVNGDHLAFRYEIMDTLGKGSFGQVLNCRDHQTGESVAIKIIRNKKRFHHQALVEIKILDNLRKWVRAHTSVLYVQRFTSDF